MAQCSRVRTRYCTLIFFLGNWMSGIPDWERCCTRHRLYALTGVDIRFKYVGAVVSRALNFGNILIDPHPNLRTRFN